MRAHPRPIARQLGRIALSLAALVPSAALADTIYRWTDASGVTHFSDAPPAGAKAQAIEIAPAATAPAATPDWRKQDEEFQRRHRARQEALDEEIRARRLEAELDAIKQGRGTPVPGETFADPDFQKRVLWALVSVDQVEAPDCSEHAITRTESIGRDVDKQEISERWVLDRCGAEVGYRISFMPFYLASTPTVTPSGAVKRRSHAVLDERASFTFERETSPP